MMSEDGHPDPSGPDEPEEETKARDGNVREFPGATKTEPEKEKPDALADRTDDDDDGDAAKGPFKQEEIFIEEAGRKLTLGSIVQRGTPISYLFSMEGKSINAIRGGLIDPYDSSILLLADCVVDSYKTQYIRDGDGEVKEVKVYLSVKPRQVAEGLSENAQVWLREAKKRKKSAKEAAA
jgi:hypothetical protein